jgi:5-methylcytosine-specific restriction endonuclease McrA
MAYRRELKDPRWIAKRKQILARDKKKCTICNGNENLHVHHLYYIPKLKPWEYDDEGLKTVCDLHHELLTFELPKLAGLIAFEILKKRFDIL